MADAIAAYKAAFSSFKKNVVDYAVYSVIYSAISGVLSAIVALAFIVFGFMLVGTFISLVSSGNAVSLDALGAGFVLLVMLAGLLIFLFLQCGLLGAYLETVHGFLSGRKQSFAGFFSAVPRHAGRMFFAMLAALIITSIPLAAAFAIAGVVGLSSIPGIAIAVIGIFISYILSLLFMFVPPAVAVDGRGAIDALKSSLLRVVRSPVAFIIFLVITALVALPGITLIYVPFVLLPLGQAALVAFYKQ